MTEQKNKLIVSEYIEKVWNGADVNAFEDLTGESFTYTLGGQPPRGGAEMKMFLQSVHTAFPDWSVNIESIVAEEDGVAVRWSGCVTHDGVFLGIAPTGKQVNVSGINFYKLDADKIVGEWEQMDSVGMLQQMGVLPPPPSK